MKVILLAGGFGTRLAEYTDIIPKPMVSIGGRPILEHIMRTYSKYGHKDFYVALGYKPEIIKQHFANSQIIKGDIHIDMASGKIKKLNSIVDDWKITLINTGLNSMTGGRVKRLKEFIGNEAFMLTYGDGVADIDLDELVSFHKNHGKMVTVTGVRPKARFGELKLDGSSVTEFKEKPQTTAGWINGGYFICQPEIFDYIEGDDTDFEGPPLEAVAEMGELQAYLHSGFWQCMDTKRDRDQLERLWASGNAPWQV
jgi:glucose-1-phosphate cytidylyltransferase